MRGRFVGLALLMAACGSDDKGFPVGGGGFDGGGLPVDARVIDARLIDAAMIDGTPSPIDANLFMGRVCLVADPRTLDVCSSTGAGGLTVRLGPATTVTAADGTFSIAGSNAPFWVVTGSTIVTTVKNVGDYEIPAISRTLFSSMISTNLMPYPPNPGEGHLIAQLIHNAMPVPGATAEPMTTATWNPFYNGSSATQWTQTDTGTNSTVWIPSIDVGTVTEIFHGAGEDVTMGNLSIQDGAITFTTVIFP